MKQMPDTADLEKNNVVMNAQCHLKMLLPNHVAGAIIGRDGTHIGEIFMLTRCHVRLSESVDFFPGTYDRILVMGGSIADLQECIKCVLKHWINSTDSVKKGDRKMLCKLAIPCSAVSGLIGKQGNEVKVLRERTQSKITMSPRVEGMQERIVLLHGRYDGIVQVVTRIAEQIQGNPHTKQHLCLKYDIQVPLGAWFANKANPVDPSAPLIRPEDVDFYTKRELITCLQQVAPRDILLRHNLIGKIENTMKCKGQVGLKEALQETWDARWFDLELNKVSIREPPITSSRKHALLPGLVKLPLPIGLVSLESQAEPVQPYPAPAIGLEILQEREVEHILPESPDVNVGDVPIEKEDPMDTWQFEIPVACFQKPERPNTFHRLRDADVRFEDRSFVVTAHDMLGNSQIMFFSNFDAPLDIARCSYRIDPHGQEIGINVCTRGSYWEIQSDNTDSTETGND